jgi:hypothetical protein
MLSRMRGPRGALVLVAGAVLLLVVLVARGETAIPHAVRDIPLERGLPEVPLGGSSGSSGGLQFSPSDPALAAKIIAGLAAVLVLLGLVVTLLSWLRGRARSRAGVGEVVEPVEGTIDTVLRLRLKDAVTQARDLLVRPGGTPGDAVIQAWVTLEGATGQRRAPHQTATEFTVALLEKENADENALRELRTLYQRARFGHASDEHDVAAARDALDRILVTIR